MVTAAVLALVAPALAEPGGVTLAVACVVPKAGGLVAEAVGAVLLVLAELAGLVTVTVHAESDQGFDKTKLENGVLEPLRESDLIK